MVEYIEREKAIAICQSYYEHCLEMHDYCGDSVAYDIRSNIQGLPTADVVPVVRCKDCIHHKDEWCEILKSESPIADGFCCYGERKDSND